jgi:hypothetical protein
MRSLPFVVSLSLAVSIAGLTRADEVTTEFVTLGLGGGVPTYYYRDNKEIIKLEVTAQGIGAPVTYRGPALLSLYDNPAALAPRDSNEPEPVPVLQAKLPVGEDRILLVFSAAQTAKGSESKLHALGISTLKMKQGDYRVFNFSRKSVYAIMDSKKAVIQPGKPFDLSSSVWRSRTLDMEVKIGLNEGDGLRQVYSSVWGHRPTRRTFLFVFDRPDEFRPLEIRRYHDVPKVRAGD